MIKRVQLNPILISLIKNPDKYISGEKIALELGITRAAVHKKIEKLRQEGFNIGSQKGFLLHRPYPYQLIAEEIYTLLNQDHPQILFTAQCDSTNTIAKKILPMYNQAFFLITRNQQIGRGRMDRSWQMQADHDIAFSFAAPCDIKQTHLFSIIRLASLAVYQVLSIYSDKLAIKWPNDIINTKGQKICGILTESILEDNQIRYLIIGIGINVNSIDLPEYATSVKQLTEKSVNINQLFAQIITNISSLWNNFPENMDDISTKWEQALAWKNQEIILQYQNKTYQGKLKSIMQDGSLILLINNQEQTFFTGDLSSIQLRKKVTD